MDINLFYQMFVLHRDLNLIYKFFVLLKQHVEYHQLMFHINHDHIVQILQMNGMQLYLKNQLQIQNDNQDQMFHVNDEHVLYEE